jgi:type 1 glutamine amidotransferase
MKTCWWALGALLAACLLGLARSDADEKATPLKVCLVSGALEYDSDASLGSLQRNLEKQYHIACSRAFRKSDSDLPGLDNLDTCNVMVLFTRRLMIDGDQLERVKKYCLSGKPLVGIRTASHAFQKWLDFDREVLGGNYQNHYPAGQVTAVTLTERARNHPIFDGVKLFQSAGSLYKNSPLARDADVLLTGSIPGHTEPIAWTRSYKQGRVFYTSLGHQQDFADESFLRMIANAVYWTTKRLPEKR